MAKKLLGQLKLQIPAGQANPSPPVGPALGQRGINIMEFCKAFNAKTQSMEPGLPVPVVIDYYQDKSFTFITKTPPATVLLKKAAKLKLGKKPASGAKKRATTPSARSPWLRSAKSRKSRWSTSTPTTLTQLPRSSPVPPARWASKLWSRNHGESRKARTRNCRIR